jgi:pimeloyl-ACP methyl ester carboxylesterase
LTGFEALGSNTRMAHQAIAREAREPEPVQKRRRKMTAAGRDQSLERSDGRRVAWCEFGDSGGWPLLYCHGTPGSRFEAALFARAAAARRVRLIALDRPGYGDTSPLPARALGEETADVAAVLDSLGLSCVDVLGFSGGGPHAMAFAACSPDRTRRVGLVSSFAPLDQAGTEGMADAFRDLWELAAADFPAFETAFQEAIAATGDAWTLLHGGAPAADRAVLESAAVAEPYRDTLAHALRQGPDGMFGDVHALVSPWRFDVADVRQPTRIHHGADDLNTPIGMGRWLARCLPEARLTEWPGRAHFALFERPDEVVAGVAADPPGA